MDLAILLKGAKENEESGKRWNLALRLFFFPQKSGDLSGEAQKESKGLSCLLLAIQGKIKGEVKSDLSFPSLFIDRIPSSRRNSRAPGCSCPLS